MILSRTEPGLAPMRDHHGSHTRLLDPVAPDAGPSTGVDAVIVPAARPTESLETAIRLAKDLGAACLALCSKHAAAAAAAALGTKIGAEVVAVQTTVSPTDMLPAFETSAVLREAELGKNVDIALKRNLALVVARLSSCKHVFFLDDDVVGVNGDHVTGAAGLLHDYDAVGLDNHGFPDNSVVCHANREAFPGSQEQFISTMALALPVGTQSFFPDIYNEDWLFFLGDLPEGQWKPKLAATGEVVQKEFDPFADPERARSEEFGDTIAEGLFRLLDLRYPLDSADREYWTLFLDLRRAFIDRLLDHAFSVWGHDRRLHESRVAALEAARKQSESFTAEYCARFVNAWRTDLEEWRHFVARLETPGEPTITGALQQLGLAPHTYTSG